MIGAAFDEGLMMMHCGSEKRDVKLQQKAYQ
jgi:hypothetical protein